MTKLLILYAKYEKIYELYIEIKYQFQYINII